jgi:hypothetical protein
LRVSGMSMAQLTMKTYLVPQILKRVI